MTWPRNLTLEPAEILALLGLARTLEELSAIQKVLQIVGKRDDYETEISIAAQEDQRGQTGANRENTKKSSGPRTTQGKNRSHLNSTTHSLYAKVLGPSQDTPELSQYMELMMQLLAPRNALEKLRIKNLLNTR